MNKKEILKAIMELPKGETNNSISTMNSINVNDLMSAIDRLNKVPTYDELLKENKKQKEVIDKIEKYIEKQARMYGLSMPIELGTHLDNILGILNEVSE